jgi:hypothetical protein
LFGFSGIWEPLRKAFGPFAGERFRDCLRDQIHVNFAW